MAQSPSLIVLEELLEEAAATEEEDVILDKLKELARNSLPEGWRLWKTENPTKEGLFGESIDPQLLNKIRIALPTLGVVQAFYPDADYIAEKPFREMKASMLNWAFCRALIVSPTYLVSKIKELKFVVSLEEKAFLRRRESTPAKRSRIGILEEKVDNLINIITRQTRAASATSVSTITSESDKNNKSSSDIESSFQFPPYSGEYNGNKSAVFNFDPEVKEDEPSIPVPSETIKAQGIACQKLGSSSWNRIRYKDVQKRLQASPVFNTLKHVNDQLCSLTPKSFHSNLLAGSEKAL
ncbi:hypothetical protein ACJJTC_004445 [Scirpophaga incertulas]